MDTRYFFSLTMEGPVFRFVFFDTAGKPLHELARPFSEAFTVAELKDELFAQALPDVKAKKDDTVLCKGPIPVPPNARVLEAFPEARQGKVVVTLASRSAPPPPPVAQGLVSPRNQNPAQIAPPAAPATNNLDMAAKAAKNLRSLGRVDEARLAKHLASECSPDFLEDLSQLKKLGTGGVKKRTERSVSTANLEFTQFYNKIKEDVRATIDRFDREGGTMLVGFIVDPQARFRAFAAEIASNNHDSVFPMLQRWVKNANEAVLTSQRFAIAGNITLGQRLEEARNEWNNLKGSPEAEQLGVNTLDAFYKYLGLDYTVDYIRKLIQIGVLGRAFPNLAFISCCGIGEIIKFSSQLLEMLNSTTDQAMFWRTDARRSFGWTRRTEIFAGDRESSKKIKFGFNMDVSAPNDSFMGWNEQRLQMFQQLQAENQAADTLQEEKQKALDELVEDTYKRMQEEEDEQ